MNEELHRLIAEARAALDRACPGLVWEPIAEDHEVDEPEGGPRLRVGASRADGPLLRVGDEPEIVSHLNDVLGEHGFPVQRPSGGSPWGDLVVSSRRERDGASFEWRGRRGVRLWVDLPV